MLKKIPTAELYSEEENNKENMYVNYNTDRNRSKEFSRKLIFKEEN